MASLTRSLLVGVLLAISAAVPRTASAQPAPETKLKAAIISKFPQFIEWPPAALDGRGTLDLCVAPPDPFGADLDELVAGESIGERKLTVRRLAHDQDLAGCQVLVVAGAVSSRRAILQRAATMPILTVGDDPRFLDEGGMVRLRLVGGRVRFDVDAAAARRAGLRISSQLLQLAVDVRGAEP